MGIKFMILIDEQQVDTKKYYFDLLPGERKVIEFIQRDGEVNQEMMIVAQSMSDMG